MAATAPSRRSSKRAGAGVLAVLAVLAVGVIVLTALLGGQSAECGAGTEAPSATARHAIPAPLLPLFQAAGQRYSVPWPVLAAINDVETNFGRDLSTSSAGAQGWMQFEPATWRQYAVDGNGDGRTDINDPADAIPTAARYLQASGAAHNLPAAIFAYNHAGWYVAKVLAEAHAFAQGGAVTAQPAGGCVDAAIGNASAQAVVAAANALAAQHVPYNFGGGHVTPARPTAGSDGPFPGLDCSSSVSWVLQHAGLRLPTLDSSAFMSWGDPGPGRYVTLYTNPTHIFMRIANRYFGTSGFGHPESGGGPAWFTRPVSPGYLAGFVQRHPPGL